MRIVGITCLICGIGLAAVALAAETQSPYAGYQERDIKALSDRQIQDLRAGRGMRLALPAELNGYPGPRHVLDLADQLDLTPAQRRAAQALFDRMRRDAVALGERIVAAEARLDAAFADTRAEAEGVRALVAELAALQGELRFVHLRTHLPMRELLSATQVRRYGMLRGYGAAHGGGHSHQ